jgi:RNA polymerase sigma factor (sigma-70 family)
MAEVSDTSREGAGPCNAGAQMAVSDVNAWFVREVLPLEPALMQFFRRSWRNRSDIEDLCHDVYVRVYESALREIPHPAKPFVFTVARNLLINRVRRENVVAIDAVADLDTLGIAVDEPGPDRSVMAREELRHLQGALDRLPPRCREAVILRKIDGLPRREIATRMGIAEATVAEYLAIGIDTLADILHGDPAEFGSRS